jgi:hypothetical protein
MAKKSLLDDMAFREALDAFDVPALFSPMPAGQPHWIYEPPTAHRDPIAIVGHALRMIIAAVVIGLGAIGAALYVQGSLLQFLS